MRQRILQSFVVCLVVGMYCSSVFALNLIGPPTAELSKGQLELGLDYSYSKFGLDFDFSSGSGFMPDFSREKMKMDTMTGRLGYGFSETVEGFARLGSARIRNSEYGQRLDVDGTNYGFGAKVTFLEYYLVRWGIQAQVNLVDTEGEWSGWGWTGDADVKFMQILVTGGPNYDLTDTVSMYGGPLLYLLNGEKEYTETSPTPGWSEKYDIENMSNFGGYIGLQMDLPADTELSLEYQITSDDGIFALSFVWRH